MTNGVDCPKSVNTSCHKQMKDVALPKVSGENMYTKKYVHALSVAHIQVFSDLSATSNNEWWGNAHTKASHVRAHTCALCVLSHHHPLLDGARFSLETLLYMCSSLRMFPIHLPILWKSLFYLWQHCFKIVVTFRDYVKLNLLIIVRKMREEDR